MWVTQRLLFFVGCGWWLARATQALQVSSHFRELEKKYGALTSMVTSQNQFIARLEKQCQCRNTTLASPVRRSFLPSIKMIQMTENIW